ncbi:MAG: RNA polymerase sigma factor, partial [Bacteroidota bacterium]
SRFSQFPIHRERSHFSLLTSFPLKFEPNPKKGVIRAKMRQRNLTYDAMSDEKLMEKILGRDTLAFDHLYERYQGRLLRYFYRMLGQNEEKAQDFLQDLFVKIIDKPDRFDPNRKFSTWVFSVAANMCKNEYRRQEVRKIMVREEHPEKLMEVGRPPEEQVDRQTFAHQLSRQIGQLSENHRQVFILRFQEELSIKEISQVMQCSEGTVKSRIFYALRKLAGQLQAFNPKKQ